LQKIGKAVPQRGIYGDSGMSIDDNVVQQSGKFSALSSLRQCSFRTLITQGSFIAFIYEVQGTYLEDPTEKDDD
jgi:hypothetical protein